VTLFDVCLFAGETDMLTLRLLTLKPVVDRFVVVACTRTHQAQPVDKLPVEEAFLNATALSDTRAVLRWVEPSMNRVKTRPNRYSDGEHIVEIYERSPDERGPAGTPWFQHIEKQHRDGVRPIVAEYANPHDVILVSDVDEIPDPQALVSGSPLYGALAKNPWVTLGMRFHSTALDLLHPQQPWWGTCIARLVDLDPQAQRDARTTVWLDQPDCVAYPNVDSGTPGTAGVHLSWFGTDEERQRKLETFSHAELAGWDPAAARRRGEHANGEKLSRLTLEESYALWYPKPLVDGTFRIPDGWFSTDAFQT